MYNQFLTCSSILIQIVDYYLLGAGDNTGSIPCLRSYLMTLDFKAYSFVPQVPLNAQIQQLSDAGTPIVISDRMSPPAKTYTHLAERIRLKLQYIDEQMARDAELGAGAPPPLV